MVKIVKKVAMKITRTLPKEEYRFTLRALTYSDAKLIANDKTRNTTRKVTTVRKVDERRDSQGRILWQVKTAKRVAYKT